MSVLPVRFVKSVVAIDGLPAGWIPEIAASGRSNVGKSSLLNAVFGGRKGLAKVSQTPGKTRQINFFAVGERYHLVDLPGYGYARVPEAVKREWAALVEGYLASREQLAGVLQLVDLRHGATKADRGMLDWLARSGRPTLVVGTKSDKLKRSQRSAARNALSEWEGAGLTVVEFSAVTREGRKPVLDWIDRHVDAWERASRAPGEEIPGGAPRRGSPEDGTGRREEEV